MSEGNEILEEHEAFKRLRRALEKIASLKHARRILNSEIRKKENEIERIRSRFPNDFENYMKKLKDSIDELEQNLE